MKTQYTPGPWNITEEPDHDGTFYAIRNRRGYLIATTATHDLTKEREANARLIASAPELLEALEALLFDYNATLDAYNDYRISADGMPPVKEDGSAITARAAISKAKGEK